MGLRKQFKEALDQIRDEDLSASEVAQAIVARTMMGAYITAIKGKEKLDNLTGRSAAKKAADAAELKKIVDEMNQEFQRNQEKSTPKASEEKAKATPKKPRTSAATKTPAKTPVKPKPSTRTPKAK